MQKIVLSIVFICVLTGAVVFGKWYLWLFSGAFAWHLILGFVGVYFYKKAINRS